MDLSIPGSTTTPLSTPPVFADNVQDLLGTGALQIKPSATIVVNSIDDASTVNPGVTTLRDAIKKANADSGEDLIVFDRSLFTTAQTITLNLGELDITKGLDIIAPRDTLTGGDLVTVSGNKASRVFEIESGATVTLSGLIVADGSETGDYGGGIKNSGTLTLDSSIIRNNSANRNGVFYGNNGGGIYSSGTLTVNNSTISGNSATQYGGGIYNDYTGTLTLLFNTVTQNQAANAGGVYQNNVRPSASAIRGSNSVRNTIIASNLNSAGGVNPNVSGKFTSNGYNLIGSSTGSTGFSKAKRDIVGTSTKPIDPRLGVLASNGGSTQTIALLPGSPAINAGDPTVLPTDPTTDQRGKPRVSGGRADIGAFELS